MAGEADRREVEQRVDRADGAVEQPAQTEARDVCENDLGGS
jgi:hypothetical protein